MSLNEPQIVDIAHSEGYIGLMFERIFGRRRAGTPPQLLRPARINQAALLELRVGVMVFDPLIEAEGGRRLSSLMGWHDPEVLAGQYIEDLAACSGGLARYTIAEWQVVDAYPRKIDGFRYDDASFMSCWQRRAGFHQPDTADYDAILREFNFVGKINSGVIDEVWLFGFPYAGFYESRMIGPDSFWCNAPPAAGPAACAQRVVVMGFNFERDVGCMLENFGHRVESIMSHVYRSQRGERNLWERFMRYDRSHPGRAECGNVHFAPSSASDYDWGNRRVVLSRADSWYGFPDLSGPLRPTGPAEWGGGDMRAHHLWWLDHLPRVSGSSDAVSNNWWGYVLQPQTVR